VTLLAQEILELDTVDLSESYPNRRRAISMLAYIQEHLTGGKIKGRPIPRAERFVFEESPTRAMERLIEVGQIEYPSILPTLRYPFESMWFEWPIEQDGLKGREGIHVDSRFVGSTGEGAWKGFNSLLPVRMSLIRRFDGAGVPVNVFPVAHGLYAPLPREEGEGDQVRKHFSLRKEMGVDLEHDDDEFAYLRTAVEVAIFLLITPRVAQQHEVTHGPAIQKKRVMRGKPPLVDYKRVTLTVGVRSPTSPRSAISSGNAAAQRKLHPVMGHFRTYTEGRETPKISWVLPHWRGDPELGVVHRTRNVKVPK